MIKELVGKTITKAYEENDYREKIIFECDDGSVFWMYHEQDCCESVFIESIDGDLKRLEGQEVLDAYESFNSGGNLSKDGDYIESCTWTFYTIRTNLDSISIRWFGSSNGYYSETAQVKKIK